MTKPRDAGCLKSPVLQWPKGLAVLLFGCCLSIASVSHADSHTDSHTETHREDLKQVEAEIASLKALLQQTKKTQSTLETQLETNEKSLADLSKKIEAAEQQQQQEQQRLKKLQRQRVMLNTQVLEHETRLAQQLVLQYRVQPPHWFKSALTAATPAEAARHIRYLGYIQQARMEGIEQYRQHLQQVQTLVKAVNHSQQQLQRQQVTLTSAKATALVQQSKRQALLQQLHKKHQSDRERLAEREQQRQALEALLTQVIEVLDQHPNPSQTQSFVQRRGQLPMPVVGQRIRGIKGGEPHEQRGWVIRAPEGTEITAVHHGRVVFSDWLRGYGLLIIVDHGQGYMTLYARNQSLMKSEGDWVSAGDVLATLGRTGGYRHPSLYFELRHKGKPINPNPWVRG